MSCRLMVTVAVLVAAVAGCADRSAHDAPATLGSEYGIDIAGVSLRSDGDLAQLDYRVVDYEKAKVALKGEVRLVPAGGERSLDVTSVGRLGPMRQRPSSSGKRQFMLFTNTGRLLKKGDTAVLVLGAGRISGIPVS